MVFGRYLKMERMVSRFSFHDISNMYSITFAQVSIQTQTRVLILQFVEMKQMFLKPSGSAFAKYCSWQARNAKLAERLDIRIKKPSKSHKIHKTKQRLSQSVSHFLLKCNTSRPQ